MKSVTLLRTIFLSLIATAFIFGEISAQEQPRQSTGAPTKKEGSTTTTSPAPTAPNAPVPVYRPNPNEKDQAPAPQTGQNQPAPVYRPAPNEKQQAPAPTRPAPGQTYPGYPGPQQQTTIDRNYDINGDGVISKAERKYAKELQKEEKKRARDARKAAHKNWVEDHKRQQADAGLEARAKHMKGNGKGKGKHK